MRTYLIVFLLLAMTSCADQKKWNKETLVNECLRDFTKKNEENKMFSTMQLANLCDCLADRMVVKYKSFKESDKDEAGMQELGRECAMEVMGTK
jgi:hypothetical protein